MMQATQRLVVVSDLHLAPERGQGSFRADAPLAAFLTWVKDSDPADVVFCGDSLDYMVPGNGEQDGAPFDPARACERTAAILTHHEEVWDALAGLVQSADHRVSFVAGNHDPELVFPEVRRVIERRLAPANGRADVNWLVNGEALSFDVAGVRVLVEHGDLFDPWNRIDHNALREAVSLASRGLVDHHRYAPPPGTGLVHRFVNPLRPRYPWIDSLKPEREAVFPLVWAFLPGREKLRFAKALNLALQAQQRSLLDRVVANVRPARLVRGPASAAFAQWLDGAQRGLVRGPDAFDTRKKLTATLRCVAQEDHFFDAGVRDHLAPMISFLLSQGWDLVIHGHTHSAKAYSVDEGLHLNTGTWAQLLRLPLSRAPHDEWAAFLGRLERGEDPSFLRPTFVEVVPSASAPRARLFEWTDDGARSLAHWTFNSGRWAREG